MVCIHIWLFVITAPEFVWRYFCVWLIIHTYEFILSSVYFINNFSVMVYVYESEIMLNFVCDMFHFSKVSQDYTLYLTRLFEISNKYLSQNHYATDSNSMGLVTWYLKIPPNKHFNITCPAKSDNMMCGIGTLVPDTSYIIFLPRCLTGAPDYKVEYLLSFNPFFPTILL